MPFGIKSCLHDQIHKAPWDLAPTYFSPSPSVVSHLPFCMLTPFRTPKGRPISPSSSLCWSILPRARSLPLSPLANCYTSFRSQFKHGFLWVGEGCFPHQSVDHPLPLSPPPPSLGSPSLGLPLSDTYCTELRWLNDLFLSLAGPAQWLVHCGTL